MTTTTTTRGTATIADLYRTEGKAELIGGRIVRYMATGYKPHRIAFDIALSLRNHALAAGKGVACADNIGFVVPELSSGRESFSPDASYYDGPLPADEMDFIAGAPTFAVEVRSKNAYSKAAEAEIAAKRADYFEAGTKVVWDVDPVNMCIRSYRADSPESPVVFQKGDVADAEPAVPGWRINVAELFPD
jgi:Uma2 family endonuclease